MTGIQIVVLLISLTVATGARAEDMIMALGAVKATQLSGLFASVLPIFKTASNIGVQVVALDGDDATTVKARGNVNALLLDDVGAVDKALKGRTGLTLAKRCIVISLSLGRNPIRRVSAN